MVNFLIKTLQETLTGFKWMANFACDIEASGEGTVLLAYEEAIGFMCGTQVTFSCARPISG
jgi:phosphomannomutase